MRAVERKNDCPTVKRQSGKRTHRLARDWHWRRRERWRSLVIVIRGIDDELQLCLFGRAHVSVNYERAYTRAQERAREREQQATTRMNQSHLSLDKRQRAELPKQRANFGHCFARTGVGVLPANECERVISSVNGSS